MIRCLLCLAAAFTVLHSGDHVAAARPACLNLSDAMAPRFLGR